MLIQTLLKMTTSIETLILSNHSTSGLLSKYYELYKSINYWIREVISPSQKIIFKLKYVIYDYNISLLDTLLNKTKRFTKYVMMCNGRDDLKKYLDLYFHLALYINEVWWPDHMKTADDWGFFQGETMNCSTFGGLTMWLPTNSATRLHSFC